MESGKYRAKIAVLLSALYLLNGNHREARLAADRAIAADRYSTSAYVNRANCLAKANELEGAKVAYQDAITVDADAADALFNLGLLHLSTQTYSNALLQFKKLNVVMKDNAEVLFNLATTSLVFSIEIGRAICANVKRIGVALWARAKKGHPI